MIIKVLLLLHGVIAVFLLGAVTHQAVSVWWPGRPDSTSFGEAFRRVASARYATPVAVLFLGMAVVGAIIYPTFRLEVRAKVLDAYHPWATGLFEMKEHLTAIALGILPLYWSRWKGPGAGNEPGAPLVRKTLTAFVALVSWWNFLVGHMLNNIKGL